MIRSESKGLFPLRLTPFEEFMFADDRTDYPMTFFIDVGLSGSLCRPSFEQALHQALQRHPLLTSRVEPRWGESSGLIRSCSLIISGQKATRNSPRLVSGSSICGGLRVSGSGRESPRISHGSSFSFIMQPPTGLVRSSLLVTYSPAMGC